MRQCINDKFRWCSFKPTLDCIAKRENCLDCNPTNFPVPAIPYVFQWEYHLGLVIDTWEAFD